MAVGHAGTSGMQAMASPGYTAGTATSAPAGGAQKDLKDAQTAPQFGDVLKKMQAQYGAKAEKPREIKKTLGKDDFLKIMITQMKHQDPTNPFKAEQMAQEMAQFTSVEQLQNMNQGISKLANQNQPLERLAMTNLIGKAVTVDRDRFSHIEGQNEALSFTLPKDAQAVTIALVSETGEVVLQKDIGAQKAGEGTFTWDGLKSNTLPAKGGNYLMRLEAKDDRGMAIQTQSQQKVRVVGVSFEGSEPILLVGDNKHQAKMPLKSVVRIEGELPPGAPLEAAPAQPGGANFFSFQKGVGSANLDPNAVNAEAAAAIAKFQQQQQPQSQPQPPAANTGANSPSSAASAAASGSASAPASGAGASARPAMPNLANVQGRNLPGAGEERGFPNGLSGQGGGAE